MQSNVAIIRQDSNGELYLELEGEPLHDGDSVLVAMGPHAIEHHVVGVWLGATFVRFDVRSRSIVVDIALERRRFFALSRPLRRVRR